MAGATSFQRVRGELDSAGFYQPLTPECLSLAEALLHEVQVRTKAIKEMEQEVARSKKPGGARSVAFKGTESLLF